jgi:RNA polymerase subunit RPABC4/transcription elongation factor Spt4
MSLHRCPACSNLVERDSETCPICGRPYMQALIGKIVRWMLIVILLVWSVRHFHVRLH